MIAPVPNIVTNTPKQNTQETATLVKIVLLLPGNNPFAAAGNDRASVEQQIDPTKPRTTAMKGMNIAMSPSSRTTATRNSACFKGTNVPTLGMSVDECPNRALSVICHAGRA
mmetsp:Transcript_51135/g.100209  ORF Transcript_51135/g.100209 Transcript_51135/m.100209 type:complete len:112 (-) Transcript_51135:575-910(-)